MDKSWVIVLAFVFVLFLVSPVSMVAIESGSMEPTLSSTGIYIIYETKSVSSGDVVTYWDGKRTSYVTHRIIGESSDGFITQGDANIRTDQSLGDDFVQRDDVRGKIVFLEDVPVGVPVGASILSLVDENREGLIISLIALLSYFIFMSVVQKQKREYPAVIPSREFLKAFVFFMFVMIIGLSFIGTSTSFGFLVLDRDIPERPDVVEVGQQKTLHQNFTVTTSPMMYNIYDFDGPITIQKMTTTSGNAELKYVAGPFSSSGVQTVDVSLHRYPRTLPYEMVLFLHSISPIAASIGTVVVLTPFYFILQAILAQSTRLYVRETDGLIEQIKDLF